jgi:hypothetical protein
MNQTDGVEKSLLKEFNDYDQTVDVVSCWHALSNFLFTSNKDKPHFFRFGKFRTEEEDDLTPDFAIAESADGTIADRGSLICDIKKFPNPYPDTTSDEQQQLAYKIFGKSVEEVFKYAVPLKFVSDYAKLPKLLFSKHDVVLLTPSEIVDPVYKFLTERVQKKPFNVGCPLVLVEYFYSQADNLERYVFKWKQGEANSPFSHPILRDRMVTKLQPLTVYPKHFLEYKIRHILCNDPPPDIYLIVFIWVEVLLKFLSPEEIELWQTASANRSIDIKLTAQQLHARLQEDYAAPFSIHDVRRVLKMLCDLKRATLTNTAEEEAYTIHFYNLAGRAFRDVPGDQDGISQKSKFKEYGRLFGRLLAKKELTPVPSLRKVRFRSSKKSRDYPTLFD